MERIPPSERISKKINGRVSKVEVRDKNKEILGRVLELRMRPIVEERLLGKAQENLNGEY